MKMKKLLAAALAATMIFSSMVTSFVASAAQTVGTITAGTVNAVVGETDAVAADINIVFPDGVVAPHNIVTVSLAGYTLESVTAINVTYAEGSASGIVDIDTDGSNLAAGKILFEAPVDNKAPTVLGIAFTANFVDADDEDTAAGEYDIVVNGDDMTNLNEESIGIDATNGKLIVTVPHVCAPAGEPKIENEVAATCYAEGSYDSVVYCSCGKEYSRETLPVAKIAHTPAEAVTENNVPATCYKEGSYDSVVYCAVEACKAEISRTPITVDKTEHTPAEAVVENNTDATCYAEGSYDSVVYCSVEECKHEISRTPVTVDKIAHTPAAPVEENRVEAKPGVAGSYDSVVYCSVEACKAEISRTTNEIPALPEVEVCEHANLTFVSAIPATDSTVGSITYACADCDVEFTKDLTYNKYARAGYVSANAEEQTLISFGAYYNKDFSRVNADANWDQLYIVLDQTRGDEKIDSAVYGLADVEDATGSAMYKVYYGLAAFMYADDVAATVYLHDSVADKWYSGPQNKSSLKALAESMIPSATGIQKSMWVDLLNYGAAAQVNFGVNTENLANADISGYQDLATTPAAYTKTPVYAKGSDPTPMYYYMFTGAVESKICLRSYIRFPSNYAGMYKDLTGEDIKVVATWTNFAGEQKVYEEVMSEETLVSGYTNRWSFYLPLGAPDLRTDVTFTVYSGDTLISTETITSFEAYVTENYASANANFKNLCDAMMAFGDSANEFLTSK